MNKIKTYFHSLKEVAKVNVNGYYCPDCAIIFNSPTIFGHVIYNKIYHIYNVYLKCDKCGNVTPAYKDVKNAIDNIEDRWVNKEVGLFEW